MHIEELQAAAEDDEDLNAEDGESNVSEDDDLLDDASKVDD